MSIIQVEDPRTGQQISVEIAGSTPTPEESEAIAKSIGGASSEEGGFIDRFIPRNTGDWKPAIVGGGALVGGALGAGLGPLGVAAGGTLGAGAGSTVADLIEYAAQRYAPDYADPSVKPGDLQGTGPTRSALREMTYEAGFGGAASVARPVIKRAAQRFAFGGGVEDMAQARGRAAAADEEGIPLGIEDVSDKLRVKFARKVLGRFPVLSRPFRQADEAKEAAVDVALERRLRQVAPQISMAESGVDLTKGARKRFRALKEVISAEYDEAIELASTTGARIPTVNTRRKASEIVQEMTGNRPRMEVVMDDDTTKLVPIPAAMKTKVEPFAKKLRALEPDLDISQYQSLAKDLDTIIEFSRRQGLPMKKAVELKKALELDLAEINVPAVREAFQKANKDTFRMHRLFDRPTAQKFGRVDRRIFGAGYEELTAVEPNTKRFFKSVFDAGSPQAMKDLRSVVGRRRFNSAVRAHLDDAFVEAIERSGANDSILNIDALRRRLGIFNRKSSEYKAMGIALKSAGMSVQDLSRLVDVIQVASEQGSVDVSTFIARRAALGGFGSAVRAVVPGASIVSGGARGAAAGATVASGKIGTTLAAVGLMMGMRKFGSAITDPATMRSLVRVVDTDLTIAQRDAAAARFIQLMNRRGFNQTINAASNEIQQRFGLSREETLPGRNTAGGQQ